MNHCQCINFIKTEFRPFNLYISDVEFNNLVFEAEDQWCSKYEKSKTKESCVQY